MSHFKFYSAELIELHLREHVLGDTEKIKEKELNEFLALVKRYL